MKKSTLQVLPVRKKIEIAYERILASTTEGAYEVLGDMYRYIWARTLLLVCFEGLESDSHWVFSPFVRGSREISPDTVERTTVSSLYRESTDSLISRNLTRLGHYTWYNIVCSVAEWGVALYPLLSPRFSSVPTVESLCTQMYTS